MNIKSVSKLCLCLAVLQVAVSTAQAKSTRTWVDSVAVFGMEKCLKPDKFYWGWNNAILLSSMMQMYRSVDSTQRPMYFDYVKKCMDKPTHKISGDHPNFCAPGIGMAFLYGESGEKKYWDNAQKVWQEYLLIPRSVNYGASHRPNTIELWDDTVYMLGMFFLEMYRQTGNENYLKELMGQYYAHAQMLADKDSGLWFHGWDADSIDFDDRCGQVGWADKTTRKSTEIWGRGNGWILMILADVLETAPKESPMWKEAARELVKMTKNLPEWQDQNTGMWYQLPVRYAEKGNFLESSCTAMFGYAISIGVKHGVLKKSLFKPMTDDIYYGLRRHAMVDAGNGYLSPDKVCIGTCIGDKSYYFSRRVASGVDFAVGVFVMFGLEYEKQNGLR